MAGYPSKSGWTFGMTHKIFVVDALISNWQHRSRYFITRTGMMSPKLSCVLLCCFSLDNSILHMRYCVYFLMRIGATFIGLDCMFLVINCSLNHLICVRIGATLLGLDHMFFVINCHLKHCCLHHIVLWTMHCLYFAMRIWAISLKLHDVLLGFSLQHVLVRCHPTVITYIC